ncbi:hypothetical protein [Streptomyces sp. NBC_01174]|uniref:hypothetical protein n=1 Tax=Streptomyces sp. NBC_01174 TaxID=2903758 RepID=UPI0038667CE5|nr:hypothetical protein OG414_40725 [Streptomyces sp. NBC_01174]
MPMLRPYRAADALVAPAVRDAGDMTVDAASCSAHRDMTTESPPSGERPNASPAYA